jgi:hypothetical protein
MDEFRIKHPMFPKNDTRSQIFLFLLNVCLIIVTGIVLHKSEATEVVRLCPVLWETMALILTMKCLRLTLCAIVMKVMRGESRASKANPMDLIMSAGFFVTECVTTSRALNTDVCVTAASQPFDGHPLIAYVNGISAAWDGCYVLSYALFVVVKL